ncbi:SubName: Full=Uncharacterized protein {ECO:0000313/EMBL:CCA72955.1} [Serendipita indica DSM 11827]|nr:SubName: Full=Uncharacterized protein {ECO:0000313/EMBL:CCA72955.1} [Serendipita indica DSM 11827]
MAGEQYEIFFKEKGYPGVANYVFISKSAKVAALKRQIQSSRSRFKHILLSDVKLFQVDVPNTGNIDQEIEAKMNNSEPPLQSLNPTRPITHYYPSNPAEGTIHIAVVYPELSQVAANRAHDLSANYQSNISPRVRLSTAQRQITDFLDGIRAEIKIFLQSVPHFDFWAPPDHVEPEIRIFYEKLKIPMVNGKPSLLLHNLGTHHKLTKDVFTKPKVVLCNASGSGKTRVLFDGLSTRWGFYLAVEPTLDEIGSTDVMYTMEHVAGKPGWRGNVFDGVLRPSVRISRSQANERIVQLGLSRILLARWSILKIFIEVAKDHFGSLPPDIQRSWLLFQILSPTRDIFPKFIEECLRGVDTLEENSLWPVDVLDDRKTPFYYVLDEVQIAGAALLGSFSNSTGLKERTLLRPLIQQLTATQPRRAIDNAPHVIISGTGFSLHDIETTVRSAVAVPSEWHIHHLMEDLSDQKDQEAYIRQYLPESFLTSSVGRELMKLMWESCRGRHRFTATLIQLLLLGQWLLHGPASPLSILKRYIQALTGCDPLNYNQQLLSQEPYVEPIMIKSFNWDKLDGGMLRYSSTIKWLTLGKPLIMDDDKKPLVECGLGRFISTKQIDDSQRLVSIGEPLALVSICRHIMDGPSLSSLIRIHLELNPGKGFEVLVMVALTQLLQNQFSMENLFDFHQERPQWSSLTAQILLQTAGVHTDYDSILHDRIFNDQGLPFEAKTPEDVINWLTMDTSPAWCIPDQSMGPDLMTRVKLSNGGTILIAIQAKCWGIGGSDKAMLSKDTTEHAIWSVTPSEWFSNKFKYEAGNTEGKTKQITAMLLEVEKHEMLRVVAALPLVPNLEPKNQAVNAAISAHKSPLATIGIDTIAAAFSQISNGQDV